MIKMNLRSAKLPLITPPVPVSTKTKTKKTKKVAVPAQNIQVQATNEIIDELFGQDSDEPDVRLVLEASVTETVAPAMDEPAEQVAVTQTLAARKPTRRKLTLRSAASHIEPVQEQPTPTQPTQPTLELEAEVEDEPVLTPKKKRTVLKYELIKEEFNSYTDIDTYLRTNNQYHQHTTNNEPVRCTFSRCTHTDIHEKHMISMYKKCCCKQDTCSLK